MGTVSRPFLISLLETDEILHMQMRKHRLIRMEELFAYKRRRCRETARSDALDEMAAFDAGLF